MSCPACFRLPVVLVALLVALPLLAVSAAAHEHRYDDIIDITFPVDGPVDYTNDYYSPRSRGSHGATDLGRSDAYGLPVHAAVGGRVSFITGMDDDPPSYGYMISIDGDDGRTYNYIHLGRQDGPASEAYAAGIERGTTVARGQHIGYLGHSGNASADWPHLHFEIVDEAITDPDGTHRRNPYYSLVDAEERGDLPGRMLSEDHPFYTEIQWMLEEGIAEGYGDGDFQPGRAVTRQAAVAFLYRLAGEPEVGGSSDFEDVGGDHPFHDAIAWAAEVGVTGGYDDGTFRPRRVVSRQAAVAFLHRLAGEPEVGGSSGFEDVGDDHPFHDAIAWAAEVGVTTGYDDGRFRPAADVARQAMAAFLYRQHGPG